MSTPLDASRESRADRIEILKREKNTKIDQHWVWDFTSVIIEGSERARSQGRDLVVVAHSVSGTFVFYGTSQSNKTNSGRNRLSPSPCFS